MEYSKLNITCSDNNLSSTFTSTLTDGQLHLELKDLVLFPSKTLYNMKFKFKNEDIDKNSSTNIIQNSGGAISQYY